MYTRKVDLKLSIIAVMLILVFVINTFLLLTNFVEKGQSLKTAKEYAQTIVDYYQKVAKDAGVYSNSAVQNVLARFMYEINLANSNDELARVIVNLGNETQNIIRRETESRQANIILAMVSSDYNLSSIVEPMRISISFNTQGDIIFNDGGLLSQAVKDEISEYIHSIPILWERVIEMEIEHGTSRLVTPRSSEEKEQRLRSEIDMLKAEIESLRIATGYAEMTGEGLIIKLYDNPNVYGNISPYIIHDLDLLDLVNELFSSGARGIAIDGRRLTTTSSIRCVGPVIHVDHEPIRVEPIEIHVVGNPEILKSGLSLFFRTRFDPRGIKYDVQIVDQITLPAYSRRR